MYRSRGIPFKDHKTVIRGGYGIFYGPVDAQISQRGFEPRRPEQESQHSREPAQQVAGSRSGQQPDQHLRNLGFPGVPVFPANRHQPLHSLHLHLCRSDQLHRSCRSPIRTPVVFQTLFARRTDPVHSPGARQQCLHHTGGRGSIWNHCRQQRASSRHWQRSSATRRTTGRRNRNRLRSESSVRSRPASPSALAGFIRTLCISRSQSTRTCCQRRDVVSTSTVTLANGKEFQLPELEWRPSPDPPAGADPLGGGEFPGGFTPCANPFACFVNPLDCPE